MQTDCTVTQTSLRKRKFWKGICGRFLGPQNYMAVENNQFNNRDIAYTCACVCVDCAVPSYELVLGYMILYTVAVRM